MPIEEEQLEAMMGDDAMPSTIPPTCPGCGYNMTGAPTSRCPECGLTTTRRELRRNAREMRVQMIEAEHIYMNIHGGLVLACIGIGIFVAMFLIGGRMVAFSCFGRFFSLIFGLASLCLGLSVLRIYRLPTHVREHLKEKPDSLRVGLVIMFGALLMLTAILPVS